MNISEAFIRRPIATSLLSIALLLAGIVAFPLLPVAPLPQVEVPTVSVSANFPGASPETMASNIAAPLERQFSSIAGITQMTSTSYLGATNITIQFDLSRNIDTAVQDVQSQINAAAGQLPSNLPSPPSFRKVNPADSPILIISASSLSMPIEQVNDAVETTLVQAISQINGVGNVNIFGSKKPSIRIQIDPAKIAAKGLDLETIRAQIAVATSNAPKGSFDGDRQNFTVYSNDQILDVTTWNDLIVAYRNGAPVRIRDIGQAVEAAENVKTLALAYTGPAAPPGMAQSKGAAVVIAVTKQPGANVIEVAERIKAAMPQLIAKLPNAVNVTILTDRTQTIRASVDDVEFTLVLTIALVVMVIFIFLRNLSATIIPSVTIPLALFGTAGVMYVMGYSLDNLSLMALTISVGFVVDDAVVMLENIFRYVEDGDRPFEAALKGAAEIGTTIISISVSLIAVFIPILFMGGVIGRFMREFAMTVSIAVGLSVVISLTLTPMLCAVFLKTHGKPRQGGVRDTLDKAFDGLLAKYEYALRIVMDHQRATLGVFFVTLAATVGFYAIMPKGFFPQQDTRFMIGVIDGAEDISSGRMEERLQAVAEIVSQDPDVVNFTAYVGQGPYSSGQIYVNLKEKNRGQTTSADRVIGRLRPKLSKVVGVNTFLQIAQDMNVGARGSRTQFQYTLSDGDLNELSVWSGKIMQKFRSLPQLIDIASDLKDNAAAAQVTIDRDQASRFGIQPSLIDAIIYDAIGQRQVAQIFTQLNNYHVILEVLPELQGSTDLFDQLFVTAPLTGRQIPLSTLVKVDSTKPSYVSVNHQGLSPAATISFNLAPGFALGDAVGAIRQVEAELGYPPTLSGSFQGTAQAFQASLSTQPYLIAAALIAVYIVLGVLYESYIHPLTILSTLPSAGVGALLALAAVGMDISIIAIIGIILLIGIVKKNGIMMVDFALHAQREGGLSPRQAIFDACLLRFRPIMMTTMCALLAGVPLMLGTGTGSEIRQPLGYAIVGGLILSQALTLFTTPVIYLYLDRLGSLFGHNR